VSLHRYFPRITAENLHPDYSGIRPTRASPTDTAFKDFIIHEESEKGFPGFVNLIGIESPGMTASLAIAEEVARLLGYAVLDRVEL
jgi:2-hydroxyglutarate dehydrogenase